MKATASCGLEWLKIPAPTMRHVASVWHWGAFAES